MQYQLWSEQAAPDAAWRSQSLCSKIAACPLSNVEAIAVMAAVVLARRRGGKRKVTVLPRAEVKSFATV
jgi:hypothetical protein